MRHYNLNITAYTLYLWTLSRLRYTKTFVLGFFFFELTARLTFDFSQFHPFEKSDTFRTKRQQQKRSKVL